MCVFGFKTKHIKGKENKVDYALSRKIHLVEVSIFKLYFKGRIINYLIEDEYYVQVKNVLQHEKLKKKYKDIS